MNRHLSFKFVIDGINKNDIIAKLHELSRFVYHIDNWTSNCLISTDQFVKFQIDYQGVRSGNNLDVLQLCVHNCKLLESPELDLKIVSSQIVQSYKSNLQTHQLPLTTDLMALTQIQIALDKAVTSQSYFCFPCLN